jgi:GT2 family glycosyltransferase
MSETSANGRLNEPLEREANSFVTDVGQESSKIGAVTVTYNGESVLQEFLSSIAQQTYQNFTLYVVDNASRDRTLEMVREVAGVPVVLIANHQNVGVAEGNNQGIRAALADGCEYVLLLNNDTVLSSDLFQQLWQGLKTNRCDMATGKMYYHDRPDVIWCAGGSLLPWQGYEVRHDGADQRDTGQFERARRISYTPTCCLLARRSVFERIGLMDSRYFVYFDDVDFLYRAYKAGLSLWYFPQAKLWHKVSSSTGATSDFTLHYCTRNRIYFQRKHLPYGLALLWYLLSLSRSALAFVLLQNAFPKFRLRWKSANEGWKFPRKNEDAVLASRQLTKTPRSSQGAE